MRADYQHLVAAAEAFAVAEINVGDVFTTPAGPWLICTDLAENVVFAPARQRGGRCYEVDYVLGVGREAIERTARLRASVLA